MGVVSARISDEDEETLKKNGVNVSEMFRVAAHDAALRFRRLDALRSLDKIRAGQKRSKFRSEDILREDRDAH